MQVQTGFWIQMDLGHNVFLIIFNQSTLLMLIRDM